MRCRRGALDLGQGGGRALGKEVEGEQAGRVKARLARLGLHVQVRPGDASGHAHLADELPPPDALSLFDGELAQVEVGGEEVGAVAEDDGVARVEAVAPHAHHAVGRGADLFTAYFHLSEFAVEEGERVRRGQLIGKMGMTGRVTGPHLHMEAKAGKTTFDPASLLDFDFFPEGRAPLLAKVPGAAPNAPIADQDSDSAQNAANDSAPTGVAAPESQTASAPEFELAPQAVHDAAADSAANATTASDQRDNAP